MMEDYTTLDFDITPVGNSRLSDVDFDNLAFGQVFSDHMFVMDYEDGMMETWRDFFIWSDDLFSGHDVLALRAGHFRRHESISASRRRSFFVQAW